QSLTHHKSLRMHTLDEQLDAGNQQSRIRNETSNISRNDSRSTNYETRNRPPLRSLRSRSCSRTRTTSSEPAQRTGRTAEQHSFLSLESRKWVFRDKSKAARVAAREGALRASFNGANGMSDMAGKAAR